MMKQLGLTLQERQLAFLLRWWIFLFACAGALFALFPSDIIYWLNAIGHSVFGWSFGPLALPSEHFWQILAVSLLAVLVYLCVLAQHDIRQNFHLVGAIVLSKLVTSLGFLLAIVFDGPYFAYVAGLGIDFVIMVMTWSCYHRAGTSRVL